MLGGPGAGSFEGGMVCMKTTEKRVLGACPGHSPLLPSRLPAIPALFASSLFLIAYNPSIPASCLLQPSSCYFLPYP